MIPAQPDSLSQTADMGLPDDEDLRLRCVWAAEAYGPGTLEQLERRVSALRGPQGEPLFGIGSEDLLRNRQEREMPLVGSVPHWVPPHRPVPVEGAVVIDNLPDGVAIARPQLIQVSPTLTILALCFVLDENASREGYRDLAATSPSIDGWRVAFESFVEYRRQQPAEWLRAYVPGEFADSPEHASLPTCSLVTARHFDPSEYQAQDPTRSQFGYQLATIQTNGAPWRSTLAGSLGLFFSEVDDTVHPLLFAGQEDHVEAALAPLAPAPPASDATANNAPMLLSAIVAMHTTSCLLAELLARLRAVRDRPRTQRGVRRPIRQLQTALKDLPLLSDAAVIGAALVEVRQPLTILSAHNEFTRTLPGRSQQDLLKFTLLSTIAARAQDILRSSMLSRDALATAADVHAAAASVRATYWAAAAAGIGLASLVATIVLGSN